jgi:large subunit ribosomal protein L25
MRTVEIIGYKRANLGKADAKRLRAESNVPCVLYGGKEQVHFYSPMILFRDLVYTPNAAFVKLNIEGDEYSAILQDVQFHPVSEVLLHGDFLLLTDDKPIKMDIPIKLTGNSPGVVLGGKLVIKLRSVKIKALPEKMPENIVLDVSKLELGKSIKVASIEAENFEILNNPRVTVASVEIPRTLKGEDVAAGDEEGSETEAETSEATE